MSVFKNLDKVGILWPNFSGRATEYNDEGDRNFYMLVNAEQARILEESGVNVNYGDPLTEEEIQKGYTRNIRVKVKVTYTHDPSKQMLNPNICLVSANGAKMLNEETVGTLDNVRFKRPDPIMYPDGISDIDVGISIAPWSRAGRSGVSVYLRNMIAVMAEDDWAARFAAVQAAYND